MNRSDIIILGGGLIGLALAAALDSSGLSATIVDPVDPDRWNESSFDGRTSAVSSSSRRMFDAIGLAPFIVHPGCPIRSIRVADGLSPGGLAFDPPEGDDEPLGWMHENRHLRQALRARAEAAGLVTIHWRSKAVSIDRAEHGVTVRLDSGETLTAALLVSAEGRNSATRQAAGIRVARWQYDHAAIVSTLAHEHPHDGVAWEIFYPGGPFALLPMTDHEARPRSAIVWSVGKDDAAGYLSLSDADFASEAQVAMGHFLGQIRLLTDRSSYPLGFHHAARITDRRLALVGDSAHAIHPIAGQGLNLGFRDAAALAQVLVEGARLGLDLGDRQLLDRYERWRGLDTLTVAMATDGLARLFGIPGRLPSAVRRLGMAMTNRIAPLRDRLAAEARGTTGDLPLLLRGLPI